MKDKCIVLFSGGLDSRLAVRIMQERGFEVIALHFNLPFGCTTLKKEIENFCKKNKIKLKIMDCTRGKLLKEYLQVLKKGKHGRGAGFNPCVDCKIFMFKHAKRFAREKKIKFIATGEVLGQRPMSQTPRAMKIIDKEIAFELVRPLIELGISGRNRKKQIELARKYKIKFPHPAGGCLLCEKELQKRFKVLVNENVINEKTLKLVNIGRHFFVDGVWFVVARDESEGGVIETFFDSRLCNSSRPTRDLARVGVFLLEKEKLPCKRKLQLSLPRNRPPSRCAKGAEAKSRTTRGYIFRGERGKPSVYFSKKKGKKFAEELQNDFGKGGKRKFGEGKL